MGRIHFMVGSSVSGCVAMKSVIQAIQLNMDRPVTITDQFSAIMWTTAHAFKIDFAVTTPL